ncbi:MAG: hypothetical protein E7651_09005 [Ruminococcaceae bacterium]|nr:hypothetical protein [Oscillospiraceae bacterium]
MAYCRNCRAQLKTAQVCPVCGTERIPQKKGLLRHKNLPLPDAKNGAESLRAGLREGSTLLLLIAGVSVASMILSLAANIPLLFRGELQAVFPLLISLTSFLLPAGLLLLQREKDKTGAFSTTGLKLIIWDEIFSAAYVVYLGLRFLLLPVGSSDDSLIRSFIDVLLSGFLDLILIWLFIVLVVCSIFGLGVLWSVAGIRLCKNTIRLTAENKRFRVPKYFEFGFLLAGGLSMLGAFQGDKELLASLTAFLAAAGYLLKFTLLTKVKKHI